MHGCGAVKTVLILNLNTWSRKILEPGHLPYPKVYDTILPFVRNYYDDLRENFFKKEEHYKKEKS
jgi:hypothetical protein